MAGLVPATTKETAGTPSRVRNHGRLGFALDFPETFPPAGASGSARNAFNAAKG